MANEDLLELVDEEDNKINLEVLDIVNVDDKEYALLLPHDECDCGCEHEHDEDDETEVVVMRIKRDSEEFSLETIEDEAEFERVSSYIEELEDEIDD